MAKLIKSILANRMMFRGGGLVAPSHAGGILASSSPLIDSVAMNQGGPVNFVNGGIATAAPPEVLERSSQVPSPIRGTWGFPTDVARFDPLSQNVLSGQWITLSEEMMGEKHDQWNQRRKQVMAKLEASIPEYLSKGVDQQEAFRLAVNDLSEEEKALIGQGATDVITTAIEDEAIDEGVELDPVDDLLDVDMPKRPTGDFEYGASWPKASKAEAHILNREGYVLSRMPESTQKLLGLKFPDVWKQLHALEEAQSGLAPADMSNAGAVLRERFEATPDDKKSDFYNVIKQEIKSLYEHSIAGWTQGPPTEDVDPLRPEERPAVPPPTEYGDRPGRDPGWAKRQPDAEVIRKHRRYEDRTEAHRGEFGPAKGLRSSNWLPPYADLEDRKPVDLDDNGQFVNVTKANIRDLLSQGGSSVDAKSSLIEQLITNISAGPETDIQELKADIEALMPVAREEDDQTLGLLLAQFGASLMSKPGGFLEALGTAGTEFIPQLIEYKNSIKEANRERQTAIAKLVITEKLSRGQEKRAAIRDLTGYRAKALFDQEIEMTTPGSYMTLEDQFVPASVFDPGASGNVKIPGMMPMTLSPEEVQRLGDSGINFMATKDLSIEDLSELSILRNGGALAMDLEDIKGLADRVNSTVLSGFFKGGKGLEIDSHVMNASGWELGLSGHFVDEHQWAGVVNEVHRANLNISQVQELVTQLRVLDKREMTGLKGYKGRLKEWQRAFFPSADINTEALGEIGGMVEDVVEWKNQVLGDDGIWRKGTGTSGYDDEGFRQVGNVSVSKQYDIGARILMTQIAPMLLGESGKTISDADRVLVAQALGWTNASLKDGVLQMGKLNKEVFQNPEAIDLALDRINQALINQQEKLMTEFQSMSAKYQVVVDPSQVRHGRGFVSAMDLYESMLRKTGGVRKQFSGGQEYYVPGPTLDADFTVPSLQGV